MYWIITEIFITNMFAKNYILHSPLAMLIDLRKDVNRRDHVSTEICLELAPKELVAHNSNRHGNFLIAIYIKEMHMLNQKNKVGEFITGKNENFIFNNSSPHTRERDLKTKAY